MTSNNLEAIELLKTCVERLQDQGFSSHGNTVSELNKAIDLLQADEAQDKPTCHCTSITKHSNYEPCPPKPTKETKLQDLKTRINEGNIKSWRLALNMLIDALEEEY